MTGPSATCPSPQIEVRRNVSSSLSIRSSIPSAPTPFSSAVGQDDVRLVGADAARHAFAAGLVAKEAQHVGCGGEQIGLVADHHHGSRAEHRAGIGEWLEVKRDVETVGRRGSSTTRRRAGTPAARRPRAVRRRARSARAPWCPSARSRRRDSTMSPETAKNFSPTHAVDALVLPPLRAALQDDGDRGERLDGVHQRRLAPQPVDAGERRLVARLAAVALHALEQRRLLAEDVAARGDEDVDVEPAAAAEQRPSPITPVSRATSSSARIASSSGPYSWRMKIQPCSAPDASMPASMPSITRCGCSARIWRSLNVPGSDSSALQIAYLSSSV